MADLIGDYRYLLALHLQDISKRYGLLYYDVLRGNMPPEVQKVYSEGLSRVFEYMNLRHGLEMSDIMAVHETVVETALTEFVVAALHNYTQSSPQWLH